MRNWCLLVRCRWCMSLDKFEACSAYRGVPYKDSLYLFSAIETILYTLVKLFIV